MSRADSGCADVPGLHASEQIVGSKAVTAVVHAAGGKIVTHLWCVDCASHIDLQPNRAAPVAPWAIVAKTKTVVLKDGAPVFVDTSVPRALELSELPVSKTSCGGFAQGCSDYLVLQAARGAMHRHSGGACASGLNAVWRWPAPVV